MAKRIVYAYRPENLASATLAKSLGFVDHGDRFGREIATIKEIR